MAYRGTQAAPQAAPPTQGNADPMWGMIVETAQALGVPPEELATIISFETGGTMNPMQPGPTTQWGQHRGLIQFGVPQAEEYGADFSSPQAALASQLGKDGAIVKYALGRGFKPGMSALDLYSTINAGGPGRYDASDANNGGTPGSVADKYYTQMDAHRRLVYERLGSETPRWFHIDGGQDTALPENPPEPPDTPGQKRLKFASDMFEALGPEPRESRRMAPQTNTPVSEVAMLAIPEY